tara:strand:+ start:204 stop:2132 length:1929 start_codon:yes stop_codon:yes gene_type:complete
MPLITKHTNLKSIKFGVGSASDRPGGGYSNQPYIITDLPENSSDPSNIFNTGGPDFLLRGGLMAPIRALKDVSRLAQMFFDLKTPNGLLFTIKQNVLSRTSVETEASKGPGTAMGLINQGVYLPTSTIAQALIGFAGIHGNLLGINPFSPGKNTKLNAQKAFLGLVKYETAALYNNREETNTFTTGGEPTPEVPVVKTHYFAGEAVPPPEFLQTTKSAVPIAENTEFSNRLLDIWDTKQMVKSNDVILDYGGGPGSILGIGKTRIKFAGSTSRDRTGINNPLYGKDFFNGVGNGRNEAIIRTLEGKLNGVSHDAKTLLPNEWDRRDLELFDIGNLYGRTLNTKYYTLGADGRSNKESIIFKIKTGNFGRNLQDFRKELFDEGEISKDLLTLAPNYSYSSRKSLDSRTYRGDPGAKNLTNDYTQGNGVLDKINGMQPFWDGENPFWNGTDDLVNFSIGILKNDGSGESTYMHFRSFINSFSDAYSSEWGDVQYIGRGDKFHNYKGYSRTVSMDWTCYAQSKQELIPMYKKLNFLASSLAPDYSTGGFMRGNLARLTVGGYLYNQLGIIKSLTYTVPQESTWEIGINTEGGEDKDVKQLPHMINVTGFSFTPIENSVPQKGSRFISLSTGVGNENTNYAPGSYE